MSKDAVLAFINASETDKALDEQLGSLQGTDAVIELAAKHGFEFTSEEFAPIVQMLRFLNDVNQDETVRHAISDASDNEAVATIAQTLGYDFAGSDLECVSYVSADDSALTDAELETVAGGAGIDNKMGVQSGLRVQLQQSRQKTTTGKSFSEIAASGLNKSADTAMSAAQIAAPFIPGGSVLSAAMSG